MKETKAMHLPMRHENVKVSPTKYICFVLPGNAVVEPLGARQTAEKKSQEL